MHGIYLVPDKISDVKNLRSKWTVMMCEIKWDTYYTRFAMMHCVGPNEATVGEYYRSFEWLVLMPPPQDLSLIHI